MIKSVCFYFIIMVVFSACKINSQTEQENYQHAFSGHFVFSIDGGITLGETDYKDDNVGYIYRGSINYFFKASSVHIFNVGLSFGMLNIMGTDTRGTVDTKDGPRDIPPEFSTNIFYGGAVIGYNLSINNELFPYFSLGVSNQWFNPKDGNGNVTFGNETGLYDKSALSYDIESGIRILVSDHVSINLSVSTHLLLTDYIDDIASSGANDTYGTVMIGFSFSPFTNEDFDQDGIINSKDLCPEQAEDIDGFQDEDGCPDYDNDNDGIPDAIDLCPDEAEDIDNFEDRDGCPDIDNDNDGILDVVDKCPNEKEDMDNFQDDDGCPDYDNDNDGIADSIDQCIDQPETVNGINDDDGCPDSLTANSSDQFTLSADAIFNPNSAQIKFEAKDILDKIISVLKSDPKSNWRIEGHMDKQGTERFIRTISFERAKAILEYFSAFGGLDKKRFKIFGMGDKLPVANNNTEEGRSKNRRIEIIKEK